MARWKLTEPEFYWLVGLLEGEGSFALAGGQNCNCQGVRLDMTDEDTVYRARALLERLGDCSIKVLSRDNSAKSNWKDSYYIQIYGESARQIMRDIVPHMSYRRRQQIWQALNGYKTKKFNDRSSNIINIIELMKENANG